MQCYLPPSRGDISAFTPAEDDARFYDLKGCKVELTWWLLIHQGGLPIQRWSCIPALTGFDVCNFVDTTNDTTTTPNHHIKAIKYGICYRGIARLFLPVCHPHVQSTSGTNHICLYSPVTEHYHTLAGTYFSSL